MSDKVVISDLREKDERESKTKKIERKVEKVKGLNVRESMSYTHNMSLS